jgi:hypothetical protein
MKVEKWAHDLLFVLAEEATEEFAGRLPGPELHRLSEEKPNKFMRDLVAYLESCTVSMLIWNLWKLTTALHSFECNAYILSFLVLL